MLWVFYDCVLVFSGLVMVWLVGFGLVGMAVASARLVFALVCGWQFVFAYICMLLTVYWFGLFKGLR